MTHSCGPHHFPRAHIDPIDDAAARLIIDTMMATPKRPETIVVLLDHEHRGVMIINVSDTDDDDAVLDVADIIVELADRSVDVSGVLIASIRPAGTDKLDDVERWLELDARLSMAGVALIEWFVYGRTLSRPRVLVGEPARWAA